MFENILDIPLDNQMWFLAAFFWTIFWKGMALWKASKKDHKPWFIAFLFVNTLGILEILYVYVIADKSWRKKTN